MLPGSARNETGNADMNDETTTQTMHELDVKGLNCPLPILRTKKVLSTMASGQRVRVQATDPGALIDFAAFCRHTGNLMVSQAEQDGVITFVLERR